MGQQICAVNARHYIVESHKDETGMMAIHPVLSSLFSVKPRTVLVLVPDHEVGGLLSRIEKKLILTKSVDATQYVGRENVRVVYLKMIQGRVAEAQLVFLFPAVKILKEEVTRTPGHLQQLILSQNLIEIQKRIGDESSVDDSGSTLR